jgi:ferric-dicitrate binding protein FerR (iron transport regulator)
MPTSRIVYLLQQYLDKRISKEELVELNSLLEDESAEEPMQRAMETILRSELAEDQPRRVYSIRKIGWMAAAAVVLMAVTGLWLIYSAGREKAPASVAVAHDAAPGGNKALLTLGNGDTIQLDEARAGLVGQQGRTRLIKSVDAQLLYEGAGGDSGIQYNVLATPRGGQYKLVLPDGTRVWLNAATTLRYPTAFTGKDRVVELDGEAYFEVAANASRPFQVDVKNGQRVDVLGTHFNIMSYADEPVTKTTLLEGSVQVSKDEKKAVIRPGQEAQVGKDGSLVVMNADGDGAVAWKNGLFKFEEADMEQVMRQLSRWYDLQVVYTRGVPRDRFQGEMYRDVNLSKIVKILEASGVHFRIEGKKLLVQ